MHFYLTNQESQSNHPKRHGTIQWAHIQLRDTYSKILALDILPFKTEGDEEGQAASDNSHDEHVTNSTVVSIKDEWQHL